MSGPSRHACRSCAAAGPRSPAPGPHLAPHRTLSFLLGSPRRRSTSRSASTRHGHGLHVLRVLRTCPSPNKYPILQGDLNCYQLRLTCSQESGSGLVRCSTSCFMLRPYGDRVCENMHALGANLRKLPASENMHATRRCDGCENMQTVTNTRFTNSPSHKHETSRIPDPGNTCHGAIGRAHF